MSRNYFLTKIGLKERAGALALLFLYSISALASGPDNCGPRTVIESLRRLNDQPAAESPHAQSPAVESRRAPSEAPTTRSQNADYMKRAQCSLSDRARRICFDSENAVLQWMNNVLGDKALANTLTNAQKELLFKNLSEAMRHFGDTVVMHPYSDYKSSRFIFEGEITDEFLARLRSVFENTTLDFFERAHILLPTHNVNSFFHWGVGETAEQSAIVAKVSRFMEGPPRLRAYWQPEVQTLLQDWFASVKDLQTIVQRGLQQSQGALSRVSANSQESTLSEAAFDFIRKRDGSREAREAFAQRFRMSELSPELYARLRDYTAMVDRFQPALRIEERRIASLDGAVHGGMAFDARGMGAANLDATAKALSLARDVDHALLLIRQGEQAVTQRFTASVERVQDAVEAAARTHNLPVRFDRSGDDCVLHFLRAATNSERASIIRALVESGEGPNYRSSQIQGGIPDPLLRGRIGTRGELLEKSLQKALEGRIPRELQDALHFSVQMETQVEGHGAVRLMVGRSQGVRLTAEQEEIIRSTFDRVARELNYQNVGVVPIEGRLRGTHSARPIRRAIAELQLVA